ncbi:hypothetical protein CKO51_32485, partial [Rhodopirellula sp. SM50]
VSTGLVDEILRHTVPEQSGGQKMGWSKNGVTMQLQLFHHLHFLTVLPRETGQGDKAARFGAERWEQPSQTQVIAAGSITA